MKAIYVASGYHALIKKDCIKAFRNKSEADKFIIGLDNPRILFYPYKNTLDLVNWIISKG